MIAGKSGWVMTMVGSAEKGKVNGTDVQFALASPIRWHLTSEGACWSFTRTILGSCVWWRPAWPLRSALLPRCSPLYRIFVRDNVELA